jgi:hypothetical protein
MPAIRRKRAKVDKHDNVSLCSARIGRVYFEERSELTGSETVLVRVDTSRQNELRRRTQQHKGLVSISLATYLVHPRFLNSRNPT